MKDQILRKTLQYLISDEGASENEREQAMRALRALDRKGLVTIEVDTALPESEIVDVASTLHCLVTTANNITMVTGTKDTTRAVKAIVGICGGFPGQGVAKAVAIRVSPHVKVEKRAIITDEYKIKRVRTKRPSVDNIGLSETLADLVLQKIRESDE